MDRLYEDVQLDKDTLTVLYNISVDNLIQYLKTLQKEYKDCDLYIHSKYGCTHDLVVLCRKYESDADYNARKAAAQSKQEAKERALLAKLKAKYG